MKFRDAAGACVACNAQATASRWTVTSSFFARRALLSQPFVLRLLTCRNCGTQFFDIKVSDAQLARLYEGYRGDEYFALRNGFEPWYTEAMNRGIGSDDEMRVRRRSLAAALRQAGVDRSLASVLDHGGDRGQMLKDLPAEHKAVYEISGVDLDPGVARVDAAGLAGTRWELILSCHVLEHLSEPGAYVAQLVALGVPGTVYFIEVPNEAVPNSGFNATTLQYRWLKWLVRRPGPFKLFDFVSTGTRSRLHRILPLLCFPLREHLTFFTIPGLTALLGRNGLRVVAATVLESGHIGVVAVKGQL